MPHYCLDHPDFEGLNLGQLHDHLDKMHPEVKSKQDIATFFRTKWELTEFRRSDGIMIRRAWGRPPGIANFLGVNDTEKHK